jgi:AcrR family transcriptional regulator
MSITDRKAQDRKVLKNKILDAASNIIISEGFEKLSIRKIADAIEYSPAVIYNYFRDKAEIVSYIISDNSSKIIRILKKIQIDEQNPDNTLREGLNEYIKFVLEHPEQYRAVIMSDTVIMNQTTGMMHKGVAEEKQTINYIKKIIILGVEKETFEQGDEELLAQIIWASTYGLLSRIIIEKQLNEEQKARLVQAHINFMIKGLKK